MSIASKVLHRTHPGKAKIVSYITENEVSMVSVSDTVTVAGLIPAGAFDVVVSARVTTAIVMGGGGATWSLGVTADLDRFAAGKAKALNTVVTPADVDAAVQEDIYPAATNVLFTANAGTWTSGVVRLVVAYKLMTAPEQ